MSILVTLGAFIITLGILISFHEFGHFYVARKLGIKVLRFSVGFGRPLWSHHAKDGTEYRLAWIPLGGYVKMLDEREAPVPLDQQPFAFNRQSVWVRMAVVLAGPVANFMFAIMAFFLVYSIGTRDFSPLVEVTPAQIGGIEQDSPAARAGLQVGDQVTAINEQAVNNWFDFVKQVSVYPDQAITLHVLRAEQTLDVAAIPMAVTKYGQTIGYLGVSIDPSLLIYKRDNLGRAFLKGVADTWFYTALTFKSIGQMLVGQLGLENMSGPISIALYAGDTAQVGFIYFLQFLALLSISLGVINLLPIPMLDGGHLLYYVIEAVRGKPLSQKIQQIGWSIGAVLLISLMGLAFYNDVAQLSSR